MKKAIAVMMLLAGSFGRRSASDVRNRVWRSCPRGCPVRPACPGPWIRLDQWLYYMPRTAFLSPAYWAPPVVVAVGPRFVHAPSLRASLRQPALRSFPPLTSSALLSPPVGSAPLP